MSLVEETGIHSRISYASTPKKHNSLLNSSQNSSLDDSKIGLTGYNSSPATTPVGRDNKAGWYDMHEKHTSLARRPFAEIILCGDSIIAGLSRYAMVWKDYFQPLKALNFGIGGDRTQHVLWRAENIDITTSVKFVVLHLGTNNMDRDSPECIANGILSVALTFQEKLKGLKVIVTALLPRDYEGTSYRRTKIKKVNRILKKMCRDKLTDVYFMKQDDGWTLENGNLNEELYYTDHLHLIEKGNEKFARSISTAIENVKDNGDLEYSSDDDDEEEDELSVFQYQRVLPEKRKRSRDRSNKDDNERQSKRSRRSTKETQRRRKSRSRSRSRSKFRNKDSNERKELQQQDEKRNEKTWSVVRELGIAMKKEKNDSVTSDHDTNGKNNDDDSTTLHGVAKSIDITLDKRKRLEARRNKFGAGSSITAPSELVARIVKSQKEAKEKIEMERRTHSAAISQNNKTDTNNKTNTSMRKFFSDYKSDSDPE